jgi:peptidoglycan/LPS O-acetylase OafA/YrhL
VVLFHCGSNFANSVGVPYPIGKILGNGYLGVSFFFVLFGFILAYNCFILAYNCRNPPTMRICTKSAVWHACIG